MSCTRTSTHKHTHTHTHTHANTNAHTRATQLCIAAGVLEEVVFQHTQQDGGQEAGEKQHSHAGVDDGEPVDLCRRVMQGEDSANR